MRANLKRIHSPDVFDLDNYYPEDPFNFCLFIQIMVGPDQTEVEESFGIEICTPKWMSDNYKADEVIIGRHKLIVLEYNWDRIKTRLIKYCASISGESWDELAMKMSRIGHWEFEDYRTYEG